MQGASIARAIGSRAADTGGRDLSGRVHRSACCRGLPPPLENTLAPETQIDPVWIANILAGMVVLFIGIVIRAFNASGLIAGYNTASVEERAKYDEEKLTGFVGALLIAASAVLLAGGLLAVAGGPGFVAGASWVLFLVVIIGGVVYLNTGERFRR